MSRTANRELTLIATLALSIAGLCSVTGAIAQENPQAVEEDYAAIMPLASKALLLDVARVDGRIVAVGDHDLVPARVVPPMLPRVTDLTLFTLEDCWHCHFLANTREKLWDRTLRWVREITRDDAPRPDAIE